MPPGTAVSSQRICKIGLSLLLCFSAGSLCASKPQSADSATDVTNDDTLETLSVALLQPGVPPSRTCEEAIRRSLEIAPELLALASWPLDSSEPAECRNEAGVSVVALDLPDFPQARALDGEPLEPMARPGVPAVAQLTEDAAQAGSGAEQPNPLGKQLVALTDTSLDEIRGGFELADSNLKFSFGIERAVFINGQLVASTVLNVKDLQLAAGSGSPQVAITSAVPGSVAVVQNGGGNALATQVGTGLATTVLQNSLDNQKIQNVTTVNATVNASQILRGMSVQSAVQNGIVNSLRR